MASLTDLEKYAMLTAVPHKFETSFPASRSCCARIESIARNAGAEMAMKEAMWMSIKPADFMYGILFAAGRGSVEFAEFRAVVGDVIDLDTFTGSSADAVDQFLVRCFVWMMGKIAGARVVGVPFQVEPCVKWMLGLLCRCIANIPGGDL